MKVILGSSSPRRKDILKIFFKNFDIIIPEVEEIFHSNEKPIDFACRISEKKMDFITSQIKIAPPYLIITSDTIVTINDEILGKPDDIEDAKKMLRTLSNKTHKVISSLSLYIKKSGNIILKNTSYETTEVTFKELSKITIEEYLGSINYMDKAGSYAIQENGDMIIDTYKGSISNVIGFPVRLFLRMLGDRGFINLL